MERNSWSLSLTANEVGKKRHVLLDEEDTKQGCKRVCVEPLWPPIGLDASSDFSNPISPWDANIGTLHPYFHFTDTASELTNSLDAHSPAPFKAESSIHDSAQPLSNGGDIADMPFMLQILGSRHRLWDPDQVLLR